MSAGMSIYPIITFNVISGNFGDIRSSLTISPCISGTVYTVKTAAVVGTFPSMVCAGTGSVGAFGTVKFPLLTCKGKTGEQIAGTFPSFTSNGYAINGATGVVIGTFPKFTCIGYTDNVNEGVIAGTFPSIKCLGIGYDDPVGTVIASFPKWYGSGYGESYLKETLDNITTIGICLNTKINAVSQYAGFSFDSMCVFNGKILGAGESGIFEHDGDNDGTSSILAFFELFATDLGTTKQKRFKRLFINGKLVGYLQATSIFDAADKTTYTITCPPVLTTTQVKVPMNYSDNGETISVRVSNIDGSDFSIDSITADLVLLAIVAKQYDNIGRVKATFPVMIGV